MSITETAVGTLRVYRPQLRLVHKHAKKELGQYPVLLYGKVNPSILIGSFLVRIRHTDRSRGNGHRLCLFLFSKAGKFKTSMTRVSYNKLLTNLAYSSRAGEYWPSVVFVLRSVRTATTSPGPIFPSTALALG